MTTQQLDQLAADYVAAWNTHDVDKATAFYVDDGVYEDLGPGTVARGQAEIRRYFADTFDAFPDVRIGLSGEPIVSGERVCVEWEMTATHHGTFAGIAATGKRFEVRGATVMVLRGDKIVRNTDYLDVLTIARQLTG
jgi:steroid delta-isomerase-like uncharacterized protein